MPGRTTRELVLVRFVGQFDPRAFRAAEKRTARFRKEQQRAFTSLNKNVQGISRTINTTIGGLFGFAALRGSLQTVSKFSKEFSTLTAITGASQAQADSFEKSIRGLGRSTIFTSTQVARAAANFARAGFSIGEVNQSLEGTLRLAQATAADLPFATRVISSTLRTFDLGATHTTRVVDALSKAVNTSNQTLNELGEALSYGSPTAAPLGIDLEEVLGALQILADRGIRASRGGIAIRQTFFSAIKKLSGAPFNIDVENQSLSEILDKLNALGATYPRVAELLETRAGFVVNILQKQTQELKDNTLALQNSQGESERLSEIMDTSLFGALKRVTSASDDFAQSIGRDLFDTSASINNLDRLSATINALADNIQFVIGIIPTAITLWKAAAFAAAPVGARAGVFGRLNQVGRRATASSYAFSRSRFLASNRFAGTFAPVNLAGGKLAGAARSFRPLSIALSGVGRTIHGVRAGFSALGAGLIGFVGGPLNAVIIGLVALGSYLALRKSDADKLRESFANFQSELNKVNFPRLESEFQRIANAPDITLRFSSPDFILGPVDTQLDRLAKLIRGKTPEIQDAISKLLQPGDTSSTSSFVDDYRRRLTGLVFGEGTLPIAAGGRRQPNFTDTREVFQSAASDPKRLATLIETILNQSDINKEEDASIIRNLSGILENTSSLAAIVTDSESQQELRNAIAGALEDNNIERARQIASRRIEPGAFPADIYSLSLGEATTAIKEAAGAFETIARFRAGATEGAQEAALTIGGETAIEQLEFAAINKLRTQLGESAAEAEQLARKLGQRQFEDSIDGESILDKLDQINAVFSKFDGLSKSIAVGDSEELTNQVLEFYQSAFDIDFGLAIRAERARAEERADEFEKQIEELARLSLTAALDRIGTIDLNAASFSSTNYQDYRDKGFSRDTIGVLQAGDVIDIVPTDTEEQLMRAVSNIQSGLNSFLSGIILSTESFTDQLKNFALNLVTDLAESLLFNQLSNKVAGFLGGLLDLPLGNIPSRSSIFNQGFGGGSLFGGATSFGGPEADGGPVSPGYVYRINERGTEYFVPNVGGNIIPADGGRSSGKIELHLTFNGTQNVEEVRRMVYETILPQLEQLVIPAVHQAAREQTALVLGN